MSKTAISAVNARWILDSRGNPTVAARVVLSDGATGSASVPSGASTGIYEAVELRDGGTRFAGAGVDTAVANVNREIAKAIKGMDATDQRKIDTTMIDLDGTDNKGRLGANAILAVSLAVAKASAQSQQVPLYRYLRQLFWKQESEWILPAPMMNVMNGGKHAVGSVDMQEFMVMPIQADSFSQALMMGVEVYHALKKLLHKRGFALGVGDEGGFMPKMDSHKQVLETLLQAIEAAGYQPGLDFVIALDPAASSFYQDDKYVLGVEHKSLSAAEMVKLYAEWVAQYPVRSIEDGLAEDDWQGFKDLTAEIGAKAQIVGDDLFVTNPTRLARGIKEKSANAILVKLNQIGSLTETADVVIAAKNAGFEAIISHRSGETEDTTIADFVVAANTGQIKTGAPARTDRVAKYNRLLEIEAELTSSRYATFPYSK